MTTIGAGCGPRPQRYSPVFAAEASPERLKLIRDPRSEKTAAERIRHGVLWLLFATILMIPQTLALRRHPRKWNAVRIGAALLGVAIVVAAFAKDTWGWPAIFGSGLLLFALAIHPERPKPRVDERARKLGALIVVDGGRYRGTDGTQAEARLFVGPARLWVLGADLHLLNEFPFEQISEVRTETEQGCWKLCLGREGGVEEFLYRGPFAEHLARVAESTLRSRLRHELPVIR